VTTTTKLGPRSPLVNPVWARAMLEVQRLVEGEGKASPWAIRRVASQQSLGDDFIKWARKSYGLSMRGVA